MGKGGRSYELESGKACHYAALQDARDFHLRMTERERK